MTMARRKEHKFKLLYEKPPVLAKCVTILGEVFLCSFPLCNKADQQALGALKGLEQMINTATLLRLGLS